MTKLIRVSKKTYEKLHVLAGKLQVKHKRPVSLDETIIHLLKGPKKEKKTGKKEENVPKMPEISRMEVG